MPNNAFKIMKDIVRITESDLRNMIKNSVKKIMAESLDTENDGQSYTHFAVSKADGKIVNGWNYSDIEPSELRQFKNDYFFDDLKEMGADPKEYSILSASALERRGVDPNDMENWENLQTV